ncbi:hypothetical protein [Salipiger abyssi]|uniref:hypothetical protein n=1 Tax=Salipiger abyssi TaxID=1250539 RepID=UPI000975A5AA|nr:hypothetical protein [Salipiger abyssi]
MRSVTREDDDRLLAMLALRSSGKRPSEIAAGCGLTSQYVSTVTNRVRRDDEAQEGADLSAAYWP